VKTKAKPRETEAGFLSAVIEAAQAYGWWVHHQRPAMTAKGWRSAIQGQMGFPDLVLVRPPRLIFAELKTDTGKLTEEQEIWLDKIGSCVGHDWVEVVVWRPKNWPEIEQTLARALPADSEAR
jgi:VRR-NUC domain